MQDQARRLPLAGLGALLVSLAGAAGCEGGAYDAAARAVELRSAAASAPGHRSVLIARVPHVLQKPDFCGEACAEMALRRLGHDVDQDRVFAAAGVDPVLGRGAYTHELAGALKQIGFDVGRVWHSVQRVQAQAQLAARFAELHADLVAGVPSIVCMRYDGRPDTTEHFRLAVGYDARTDELIYHEPAEAGGAYRRMRRSRFLALWPLKYERERWTVIRLALRPRSIKAPARPPRGRFSAADFAQHVRRLRARIKARLADPQRFFVVVRPPFVVIGDEPPATVRARAERTVSWAVRQLKQSYFPEDPRHILDVWLFRDERSYMRNARALFGDTPSTPYGFYSQRHRALVMNIATGGGTLVHELVHPFVEANFPDAPPWLNEGLGSLYEQSGARDGKIWGFTNWRLAGLQRALRAGRVPSFRWLTSRTSAQFYDADPGTNYAQARYLLYYLQSRGLLRKYYRQFVARRQRDPTGYQTLQRVLGERDMPAFERRWAAFVLRLRFP